MLSVTLLVDPVAMLPQESSACTTMGLATLEKAAVGVAADPPMGWEVKTSCVAEPGPVTPKAVLVAERTAWEPVLGVADAVMV